MIAKSTREIKASPYMNLFHTLKTTTKSFLSSSKNALQNDNIIYKLQVSNIHFLESSIFQKSK